MNGPITDFIEAGASLHGVPFPSGYDEADKLLESHGATASIPTRH